VDIAAQSKGEWLLAFWHGEQLAILPYEDRALFAAFGHFFSSFRPRRHHDRLLLYRATGGASKQKQTRLPASNVTIKIKGTKPGIDASPSSARLWMGRLAKLSI